MLTTPTDQLAVLGVIDPDATAAGSVSTGWIAAANFESFAAFVYAGTLGSSATLDAKLEQATSAAGAGAKDITGKAITQLTQAGTDSDKQAVINLLPTELDMAGGFTFFRLTATVATATSDIGGMVLGCAPRIAPANDHNTASVAEIVG